MPGTGLKYIRLQDHGMERGIYTAILGLHPGREISVGSLGRIFFRRGYYSYTGSARGPGGLKRVERHLQVLKGSSHARRWHIDYLLPHASLVEVAITLTAQDLECQISRRIGEHLPSIPGFGSTDCRCPGHLHFSADLALMLKAVRGAHGQSI
jgi:endonuclease-3